MCIRDRFYRAQGHSHERRVRRRGSAAISTEIGAATLSNLATNATGVLAFPGIARGFNGLYSYRARSFYLERTSGRSCDCPRFGADDSLGADRAGNASI